MKVQRARLCAHLVWALRRRKYWCQWQLLVAACRQNNVSFVWCNLSIVVIIVYIMRGCMTAKCLDALWLAYKLR
jgi:hypothetical protein